MFGEYSAVAESDDSAIEPSTAPTTPDGSVSFSPVLEAAHLAHLEDEFDGMAPRPESQSREDRSLSTMLVLDGAPSTSVKNICCVGAGYVGGPTSAIIAFQNPSIRVNVVDRDPARIASWKSKHLPIHETGLKEIVRIARDGSKTCSFLNVPSNPPDSVPSSGSKSEDRRDEIVVRARQPNLFFSTEISKCITEADLILITVNTPTKTRGLGAGSATDVTALENATREIAIHARPGAILVEKSTVPCGTAKLIQDTLEIHRPGIKFEILSNPEFLAEGTAIKDLLTPDRVIIGSADTASGRRAAATLADVYSTWVPRSRITTINVWSSELSKLVANAMLAQRISSINSISAICEKTGADIEEIALSVGLDPRIGPQYLKSGLGFGGSCFKKDILSLVYLSQSLGLAEVGEYWQQVLKLNDFQRNSFARRVISGLNNTLVQKKVTLLGYAFKNNTSDTRESPAVDIIRTFLNDGPAEIAIFDPCCNPESVKKEIRRLLSSTEDVLLKSEGGPIEVYTDAYSACLDSNAVVILTEWDEFRNLPAPEISKSSLKQLPKQIGNKPTKTRKLNIPDPRPFLTPEPSESDLLALHCYLSSPTSQLPITGSPTPPHTPPNYCKSDIEKPLNRYNPEPTCPLTCPSCAHESVSFSRVGEQLDWDRVVRHLKAPKWVFDGRGVIDVTEMEKLGVRVEAIGKARR